MRPVPAPDRGRSEAHSPGAREPTCALGTINCLPADGLSRPSDLLGPTTRGERGHCDDLKLNPAGSTIAFGLVACKHTCVRRYFAQKNRRAKRSALPEYPYRTPFIVASTAALMPVVRISCIRPLPADATFSTAVGWSRAVASSCNLPTSSSMRPPCD